MSEVTLYSTPHEKNGRGAHHRALVLDRRGWRNGSRSRRECRELLGGRGGLRARGDELVVGGLQLALHHLHPGLRHLQEGSGFRGL